MINDYYNSVIKYFKIIIILNLFLLCFFSTANAKMTEPRGGPVIPNKSLVTGKVLSYAMVSSELLELDRDSPYEHEQDPAQYKDLYELRILVQDSESIEEARNFTADKIGEILTVYTREKISPDVLKQDVQAVVSLKGDEWGSNYWIRGDVEIVKNNI